VGKRHGAVIPIYSLSRPAPNDPPGQSFFAYWCPYAQNKTFSVTLGNGAKFMFTATMDGCSFGVGSPGGPGTVRVGHANTAALGAALEEAGLDVARQQQALGQRNALWAELGSSNLSIIGPGQYRNDHDGAAVLTSTTFGWHDLGKPWVFFTQRYYKHSPPGSFQTTRYLRDVIQQV
jgi:hypothetical protein